MSSRYVEYKLHLSSNAYQTLVQSERAALSFEKSIHSTQNALRGLGLYIGANQIIDLGKSIVDTGAEFETYDNIVKFASASTKEYVRNNQFLDKVIDDLKLPIFSTKQAFADLSSTMIGTSLEGQGARDVFEGVSIAARVMHMDAYRVHLTFKALTDMMSKGTVMSEELKRQLGNSLPGALRHFSAALGMTQGELMEKMSLGEIRAEDAIPKFAKYLKEVFSKGIDNATGSIQAKQVELSNAFLGAKGAIADDLRPEIMELLTTLTDLSKWISENRTEIIQFGGALIKVGEYFIAYKTILFGINGAFNVYKSLTTALKPQLSAQTSAVMAQTSAYKTERIAVDQLAASIERLNYVQNSSNASFIYGPRGMMANTAGNRYLSTMPSPAQSRLNQWKDIAGFTSGTMAAHQANSMFQAQKATSTGALGKLTAMGGLAAGALPVVLIGLSYEAIKQLGGYLSTVNEYSNATPERRKEMDMEIAMDNLRKVNTVGGKIFDMLTFGHGAESRVKGNKTGGYFWYGMGNLVKEHPDVLDNKEFVNEVLRILKIRDDQNALEIARSLGFKEETVPGFIDPITGRSFGTNYATDKFMKPKNEDYSDLLKPYSDLKDSHNRIRGNSVNNINITIPEINGVNNSKFEVKNIQDMKNIKDVITQEIAVALVEVVNDSQQTANK